MDSNSKNIQGELTITIDPGDVRVTIHSTRPVLASRLFESKSVEETLKTLPLLFSICGQSQSVAAIRAIESAQGNAASSAVEALRERLIQLEMLREHLWRVLLEWPAFYHAQPETFLLGRTMQNLQALKALLNPDGKVLTQPGLDHVSIDTTAYDSRHQHLLTQLAEIFGCAVKTFLQFDVETFSAWIARQETPVTKMLRYIQHMGWERLGPTTIAPMPLLPDESIAACMDAGDSDGFIARPDWKGQPLETGPAVYHREHGLLQSVQHQYGHGLLLRLAARLVAMAEAAVSLDLQRPAPSSQGSGVSGFSQLETARGRLFHRVLVENNRIHRYRILAPTEWNFHPRGVATQALAGIDRKSSEVATPQAHLLIHAIDPCVGYKLIIGFEHA